MHERRAGKRWAMLLGGRFLLLSNGAIIEGVSVLR